MGVLQSNAVITVSFCLEGTGPNCTGPPSFPLDLTTSGSGSGSFQCDAGAGPEACEAEYEEGAEVEVLANADSGSEFVEFTGDCSGSTCEVTMDEERSVGAVFDAIPRNLTVNISGEGDVQCDTGSGPEACAAAYDNGTEVELIPSADSGSEFAGFENGTGSVSGCTGTSPCAFTIEADSEVDASFVPVQWQLAIDTESGSGTGTVQCDIGSGPEACDATYPHGTEVEVIPTADGGSEFAEFGGDCVGPSCELTMDSDKTVEVVFTLESAVLLSLIKGGYAEGGAVTSEPSGIDCDTACTVDTGEYEEGATVTLTAVAEEGFVFAGWLGCKFVSASPEEGVCEVTVNGPLTEVTAVFIKDGVEGPQGPPGEDGEDGEEGPQGPPGEDGEDGDEGPQGPPGEDGEDGAQGPAGQDGEDGQDGSDGSNGRNGLPGVPGVPGVQGPRGPAGPQGRIVCKARQKGKRIVVRCRVKANNRAGKRANRSQRVRWAVMQGGKAQRHGATSVRRLQQIVNRMPDGRYVLRIKGQGGTRIVVR